MFLTITTTHTPATDLGYLLHKHPERLQTFSLAFGQAHVFYPEVNEARCTAALLLEINPIELVRGKHDFALGAYVNDRPYVASSFLSVAIAQVFAQSLHGTSKERPELAKTPIPLTATIAALPSRGGESLLRNLFEPLGYQVTLTQHPLDEHFPQWGLSPYFTLSLEAVKPLSELLSHLYVLIPVLDAEKHYYVGPDEVEKLLRHGGSWLEKHPALNLITTRYLKYQKSLIHSALEQLIQEESPVDASDEDTLEDQAERPMHLHDQRLNAVVSALKQSGARRVLDLGCGEGKLLKLLVQEKQFEAILGMDVAYSSLEKATERIKKLPPIQQARVQLIQGSLMYRDTRLEGYDAAAVVEVIEHLDPPRLAAFERVVFEFAHPQTVMITTPNQEYNPTWSQLPAGKFRHHDHRFEWTRAEFQAWAEEICQRFGYQAQFLPIGPNDPLVGSPTQMGIFTKV